MKVKKEISLFENYFHCRTQKAVELQFIYFLTKELSDHQTENSFILKKISPYSTDVTT